MDKLTAIINSTESKIFESFITNYSSREERHYCAYLFAWLISKDEAISKFIENHTGDLRTGITEADIKGAKIYYEYTAIRELLDLIGRECNNGDSIKENLKHEIEVEIFSDKAGDIQKKKPDLVFYFPNSKSLLLIEAKFEMGFDEDQIKESLVYGNILKQLFPEQITNVYVSALGLNYYTEKIKSICPVISWESVYSLIPEGKIKTEIKTGLDYQKIIHPKALSNWK